METFHQSEIYWSDEENVYWSDEEEEYSYCSYDDIYEMRPKCIGCRCVYKSCSAPMPTFLFYLLIPR